MDLPKWYKNISCCGQLLSEHNLCSPRSTHSCKRCLLGMLWPHTLFGRRLLWLKLNPSPVRSRIDTFTITKLCQEGISNTFQPFGLILCGPNLSPFSTTTTPSMQQWLALWLHQLWLSPLGKTWRGEFNVFPKSLVKSSWTWATGLDLGIRLGYGGFHQTCPLPRPNPLFYHHSCHLNQPSPIPCQLNPLRLPANLSLHLHAHHPACKGRLWHSHWHTRSVGRPCGGPLHSIRVPFPVPPK